MKKFDVLSVLDAQIENCARLDPDSCPECKELRRVRDAVAEWSTMTDAQFSVAVKLDDAHRSAVFMARALRDIFNDVGNMPEVRAAFDKVEMCVSDYEGREPGDIYDEMDEELKP